MYEKVKSLKGSLEKVLPPPHSFGQSIAINDNYIVVGADDLSMKNTSKCGGVYIFDHDYNEIQNFYTDRNKSFYGWDVAITHDDTIIVGADDEDNHSRYDGAAFVFKKLDGKFYADRKLTPLYRLRGSYYGYSIDNNSRHVVISAPAYQSFSKNILRENDADYKYLRPYVYLYDKNSFELIRIFTIAHPILPNIPQSFGTNLKLCEKYLVISEPTYKKVYIYSAIDYKIIDILDNYSCRNIDIYGNTLVMGDYKDSKVVLYDLSKGEEIMTIGNGEDNFGYRVHMTKNSLIVTSNYDTDYLFDNVVMDKDSEGIIFIYNRDETGCINLKPQIIEDFCQSIKVYKDKIYSGNPIENNLYGAVNVYST